MQNPFSLTTRQAAATAGCETHSLQNAVKRHGDWQGIKPRKQPNGRLLWPRDAVLAAAGLRRKGTTQIDLRPLLALFASHGLPSNDPAIQAAAVYLLNPQDDPKRQIESTSDDLVAFTQIVAAQVSRLDQAFERMASIQRQHDLQALHRAILPVLETLALAGVVVTAPFSVENLK